MRNQWGAESCKWVSLADLWHATEEHDGQARTEGRYGQYSHGIVTDNEYRHWESAVKKEADQKQDEKKGSVEPGKGNKQSDEEKQAQERQKQEHQEGEQQYQRLNQEVDALRHTLEELKHSGRPDDGLIQAIQHILDEDMKLLNHWHP